MESIGTRTRKRESVDGYDWQTDSRGGLDVPVQLDRLIEAVFISPACQTCSNGSWNPWC